MSQTTKEFHENNEITFYKDLEKARVELSIPQLAKLHHWLVMNEKGKNHPKQEALLSAYAQVSDIVVNELQIQSDQKKKEVNR